MKSLGSGLSLTKEHRKENKVQLTKMIRRTAELRHNMEWNELRADDHHLAKVDL